MTDDIELTLRPKDDDVPALDAQTAAKIQGTAGAASVELRDDGSAVFGFPADADPTAVRGNVELAARFVLGAHWHTRYVLDG